MTDEQQKALGLALHLLRQDLEQAKQQERDLQTAIAMVERQLRRLATQS